MSLFKKPFYSILQLAIIGLCIATPFSKIQASEGFHNDPSGYEASTESTNSSLPISESIENQKGSEISDYWSLDENDYNDFRESYAEKPAFWQQALRNLKTLSIVNVPSFCANQFLEITPYLSNLTTLTLMGVQLDEDLSNQMAQHLTSLKFLKLSMFDSVNLSSFRDIKTLDTLYIFVDMDIVFQAMQNNIEPNILIDNNNDIFNYITKLIIDCTLDGILYMHINSCNESKTQLTNFVKACEPLFQNFPNLEEFEFTKSQEINWGKVLWMQASCGLSKVAQFSYEHFMEFEGMKEILAQYNEKAKVSLNLTGIDFKEAYPNLKSISGYYIEPAINL